MAMTGGAGRLALCVAMALGAAAARADTAADLRDFDFVTAKVEANYSGWPDKTAGARGDELRGLTARLRADVARGGALRPALAAWVGWFRDGHLRVEWKGAETPGGAPDERFELRRLDARTLYLRLPSFGDGHADTVRRLMTANARELARTPNLVIDVRGNGGGSDFTYALVLPWILSRPVVRVGVEVRVSPDNARLRREVAGLIEDASPEGARVLRGESERMATATTPFIRREPPFTIVPLERVAVNPKRVAVLIDGAASSGESFLLDVRQSRKVTLMGRRNSAGVLDYGESMSADAPSGRFTLVWATTRSLRLPHDPVDPDGIAPDVRVPVSTRDPVAWAAGWLARQGR